MKGESDNEGSFFGEFPGPLIDSYQAQTLP